MLVDRLIAAAQGSSCAVIYIRFMRYAFRNKSEMNNCPPFHLTPIRHGPMSCLTLIKRPRPETTAKKPSSAAQSPSAL
jgi:hypothetical protein